MLENNEPKIKKIISFVPTGDYYYEKAMAALEKEQIEKAYKYLKRAQQLSPDDTRILTQYGILEIEAQNYEHAYELIHTAHSLEPSDAEITFLLADVSGCLGLMRDAKKYAERYLDQEPDGVYALDAYEILEFVEFEQNLTDEIDEVDAEKIITQEKARRLMANRQFEEAIELLEQLIERYPDAWAAYNNLALAYFYLEEVEQAYALLHQVLRENHGNLHALCNLTVFAYYEKKDKELAKLTEMLEKIQPYDWENRYKLGATLALIGAYESAYKWLRSMHKRGFEGDAGFYYWLAQAAYFSQHEDVAQAAWQSLLALDPSKKGLEPWHIQEEASTHSEGYNERDYLLEKLNSTYSADHLLALFLLKTSPHRQEIIAHPKLLEVEDMSSVEKLFLGYALNYPFEAKDVTDKRILRFIEVAELIALYVHTPRSATLAALQLWFSIGEIALKEQYDFKNPRALAAAIDYMLQSALGKDITKKACAQRYELSPATLTKYIDQLLAFVPTNFD